MATTKKAAAAKSAATKPAAKNGKKAAAAKPAPAKKASGKKPEADPAEKTKKVVTNVEKRVTQKEQVVMLAEQGKSIDEIVELTGIKKANVQWYFSRLKLGKKK